MKNFLDRAIETVFSKPQPFVKEGFYALIILLIAALAARGVSRIGNRYQVERGYQEWDGKLNSLGARITRE